MMYSFTGGFSNDKSGNTNWSPMYIISNLEQQKRALEFSARTAIIKLCYYNLEAVYNSGCL